MNLYETAMEHARKAIKAREKIYQGQDEAVGKWRTSNLDNSADDEVLKWMTSSTAKALIADNQWQMKQAGMFALLTIAHASVQAVRELAKINTQLVRLTSLTALNAQSSQAQHHTADGQEEGFRGPSYDERI